MYYITSAAVAEWVQKLSKNDAGLTSLVLLPSRKLTSAQLSKIFAAMENNASLTDLRASGHALDAATAEALARALRTGKVRKLAFGDKSLGSEIAALVLSAAAEGAVMDVELELKGLDAAAGPALGKLAAKGAKVHAPRNALRCDGAEALVAAALEAAATLSSGPTPSSLSSSPSSSSSPAGAAPSLHLGENGIEARGAEHLFRLAAAPAPAPGLAWLSLSGNPLGPAGAAAASAALSSTTCSLVHLDLDRCALGDSAELAGAISLARTLASVSLAGCGLGLEFAKSLGDAGALRSLKLMGNSLGPDAIAALAAGLSRRLEALDLLDLGGNKLGPDAPEHLSAVPCRALHLFDTSLGPEGALNLIAEDASADTGRRLHASVTYLDLGGNKVSADAFASLAARLGNHANLPGLRDLDIGGNVAEDDLDRWGEITAELHKNRPGLSVTWKTQARPDNLG